MVSCSGEALLTIINDILDFSKIEAGAHLEHEAFNLRECVEAVIDLIGPLAGRKGLDLVYEIEDDDAARRRRRRHARFVRSC